MIQICFPPYNDIFPGSLPFVSREYAPLLYEKNPDGKYIQVIFSPVKTTGTMHTFIVSGGH
ncbi:hypothetical protein Metfor_1927 [Methanoregula formicica SMSP]|uniref:Uncharacterized protein n=1 Tax=Methanoregula formicica (strain DSM 22288 / NBRC 105244 / SMSP) TaxID=593750 RepID=L0HFZ0_METFS|nr:hypothetical protein Metfor_1927 [Methanoregula formicica SMSP]